MPGISAVRIDLGCGDTKREGFVGLDYLDGPQVDHVLDLTKDSYPFEDRSVDHVFSSHFLEHIEEPNHVFSEIGRVCRDGARIEFWTPYAFSGDAFLYGHLHFLTEELWMQFSVWHRDVYLEMLGGRWQLKRIVYVIEPEKIAEVKAAGLSLDFGVRHLKDVVKEFGVEIEFREDPAIPAVTPERVYATSRIGSRFPLAPGARTRAKRALIKLAVRARSRAGAIRRRATAA
jgi:SAM-dependent methyltransferase